MFVLVLSSAFDQFPSDPETTLHFSWEQDEDTGWYITTRCVTIKKDLAIARIPTYLRFDLLSSPRTPRWLSPLWVSSNVVYPTELWMKLSIVAVRTQMQTMLTPACGCGYIS